jgi:hypothetical protein
MTEFDIPTDTPFASLFTTRLGFLVDDGFEPAVLRPTAVQYTSSKVGILVYYDDHDRGLDFDIWQLNNPSVKIGRKALVAILGGIPQPFRRLHTLNELEVEIACIAQELRSLKTAILFGDGPTWAIAVTRSHRRNAIYTSIVQGGVRPLFGIAPDSPLPTLSLDEIEQAVEKRTNKDFLEYLAKAEPFPDVPPTTFSR